MRTLKKALCLVLVLAMVLSLSVSAFAVDKAADYKDYAKVENKEAVEVLTAIGVLNGNDDGTFGPEGNFTRAQAAKMICYLTLGKTVADALPVGATQFNDVPATHWASKFIQYCANEGIIVGNGDGTFSPDATLSASAWAKMLLCALGYNAETESMTGTGWEINVTKLAMTAGVASAEELTATFNRDMAAKLAFNTLKADMVQYTGGSKVTVNGVEIVTGAKLEKVANTSGKDYRVSNGDQIMQLCEKAFSKLSLTDKDHDDFGRPAVEWKNGTAAIGTYSKAATLTYTTAVTGGKLYTDLGKVQPTTVKIIRNGVDSSEPGETATQAAIKSGNTDTLDQTGNGVLTEVYYDADTKTATIVEITSEISLIKGFTPAKTNKDGEVTAKAYITLENGKTFETEAYSKADVNKTYVVYTYVGNGSFRTVGTVKSVATAETVTVVPTRVNGTSSFVANGTTYSFTAKASGAATVSTSAVTNKDEVVVYFDTYGYVIKTDKPAAAETNYAYVIDTAKDNSDIWSTSYKGRVILASGTEPVVVDLKEKYEELKNSIVSYTVTDGKYKLEKVATLADATTSEALKITKGVANGVVGDAVVFSSKTVFVVISGTDEKPVYNVYTGINNVPSVIGAKGTTAAVVKSDKGIAEFVVVKGAAGGEVSSTDTYYILGNNKVTSVTDVELGTYYEYAAVVNGEVTTVKTADQYTGVQFVKSVTTNDKGIITKLGDKVAPDTAKGTTALDSGLIGLGTKFFTCTSDCAVYTIENGEITKGTVDGIGTDANDTVEYTLKDGVVTAIYVTVVANAD